jgi:hypothetical protein
MTNHPITPPPELVRQWYLGAKAYPPDPIVKVAGWWVPDVAAQAAQWGADQELEACCEWVGKVAIVQIANNLRTARRPKPPSLKEQALALINSNKPYLDDTAMDTIRQALEQLND